MNDREIMASSPSSPEGNFSASASPLHEEEFATALLAVGGVAGRAMVCRTQRRVREQSQEMAERRRRARHGIGLTILGFSLLLLVLTPVIWGGSHLEQGVDFTGFEAQSMYMIGWLFPVTLVGLVLGCLRMRSGRGTRRIDHRISSRLDSLVR